MNIVFDCITPESPHCEMLFCNDSNLWPFCLQNSKPFDFETTNCETPTDSSYCFRHDETPSQTAKKGVLGHIFGRHRPKHLHQ